MTFTEALYATIRAERATVAYVALERLIESDGIHPDDEAALARAMKAVTACQDRAVEEACRD